jgi:DNA topoisomerase-2
MVPMVPYFKGFTGTVTKKGEHAWVLSGVVTKEGSAWRITDLPPGKWIQDVKEHLDDLVEKGVVQKYENHSTETQPDFKVWCEEAPEIAKTIHTSNMYLITPKGIKKYASPEEILCDYLETRMRIYAKRKAYLLKRMAAECETLTLKAKFVRDVIEGRLVVFKVARETLEATMADKGYPKELLNTKTYEYTSEEVERLVARVKEYREAYATLETTTELEIVSVPLSVAATVGLGGEGSGAMISSTEEKERRGVPPPMRQPVRRQGGGAAPGAGWRGAGGGAAGCCCCGGAGWWTGGGGATRWGAATPPAGL